MKKEVRSETEDLKIKRLSIPLSESEKVEIEELAGQVNMSVEDLVVKAVKTYGEAKKS